MTRRKSHPLLAKIIIFIITFSIATVILAKVSVILGLVVALMAVRRM